MIPIDCGRPPVRGLHSTMSYETFNEAYIDTLNTILKEGDTCAPRGQKIWECLDYGFVLRNPYNRFVEIAPRKPSYRLAAAEMVWHWRGSNRLDELAFYAPHMKRFSDDGKTIRSAYGMRMQGKSGRFIHQWRNCRKKLAQDRSSRQAYITIADERDINEPVSPPCTNLFQFFIRNDKLNMITYMRSNDAFRGLLYDVFHFTLFQEQMLYELQLSYSELEMGYYVHHAGSMHVYEDTIDHVRKCINYCERDLGCIPTDIERNKLRLNRLDRYKLLKNEVFIRTANEAIPLDIFSENSICRYMAERLNTKVKT